MLQGGWDVWRSRDPTGKRAFEQFGTGRGGRLQKIALTGEKYKFSGQEIQEFVAFWKQFRALMEGERHYLQLPVRRLRLAGTRLSREDALVDYVIGLEALLGTDEEKTELGFRFRVRGAVVLLSKGREERRENMRRLRESYELRSRVVHGHPPAAEALEKALPFAEAALRTTWHWYFERWYKEEDNRRGIAAIDEELLG